MKHRWKFIPSNSIFGCDPTDPVSVCDECGVECDGDNTDGECLEPENQENYGADGSGGW